MSLLDNLIKIGATQIAGAAAQKTGLSENMAAKAMPMVMAVLMNGLKGNAQTPGGAKALSNALENHDGGLLNNIDAMSSDAVLADGERILGHILGGNRAAVEQQIAAAAGGIDKTQAAALLKMAAPAILAALGKEKRERGLGVDDLAGLVQREGVKAKAVAPKELSGLIGLLDADGDGNLNNEAMSIGKRLLGGLFGRK